MLFESPEAGVMNRVGKLRPLACGSLQRTVSASLGWVYEKKL